MCFTAAVVTEEEHLVMLCVSELSEVLWLIVYSMYQIVYRMYQIVYVMYQIVVMPV